MLTGDLLGATVLARVVPETAKRNLEKCSVTEFVMVHEFANNIDSDCVEGASSLAVKHGAGFRFLPPAAGTEAGEWWPEIEEASSDPRGCWSLVKCVPRLPSPRRQPLPR